MKKSLLIFAALAFIATAFAGDYVVKSVKGKVQFESAPGEWKDVTVGQTLSSSTNLNTSLNSSIVVTSDGKNFTIKAMQKGDVAALVSNAGSGGIKKGAINTKSVAANSDGSTKGVATASSRASEAKEDVEWEE